MQDSKDVIETPAPGWGAPLALAALIFCAYFFNSTCSSIWDRDEARFARATAEMVSTGNYLFPTFLGKLRPDKPILIYWLMSVPVRMFGHVEWAYRLCAVFGTTLACFFTYFIGRRLFNHRTGLWGMAILAANPLLFYTGAVATSDAVLLAFITASFAVFADALKGGFSVKHAAALSVVFAGGLMTKGPVALLPLIPFLITSVMLRRELGSPLPAILKIGASVIVAALVFAAWFCPANAATNGEFYHQAFGHHVVDRISKPLENHGGYSPFYLVFYVLVIVAGFFPWTLYLPGALADLLWSRPSIETVTNSGTDRGRTLLLIWIATFLIIMTAISTKLPHYVLPIWPALALCVGAYLDATAHEDAKSAGAVWTVAGGFLFLAVALAAAAGLGFGPEYLISSYVKKPEPLWTPFANESRSIRSVFGALMLIVAIPVIFRHKVAHFASNARVLLVVALVFLIGIGAFLMPSFEQIKISKLLADQVRQHVSTDTPVTVCGYNEASLVFYLNRNVEDIIPERTDNAKADAKNAPRPAPQAAAKIVDQAVSDWAAKPEPGVLIIPKPMYERLRSDAGLRELPQIGEVHGFNYSKGHWVDVLALRRRN